MNYILSNLLLKRCRDCHFLSKMQSKVLKQYVLDRKLSMKRPNFYLMTKSSTKTIPAKIYFQAKATESNKIRNNVGIPTISPCYRPLDSQRGVPPATFEDKARAESQTSSTPAFQNKVIAISPDSTQPLWQSSLQRD